MGKSSLRNFKQWISSVWNIFDILAIAMFFVGFGVSYQSEVVSKYFFIFYLVLFCLKLLQFVTVWQSFGAYMVMIGKMVYSLSTSLTCRIVVYCKTFLNLKLVVKCL